MLSGALLDFPSLPVLLTMFYRPGSERKSPTGTQTGIQFSHRDRDRTKYVFLTVAGIDYGANYLSVGQEMKKNLLETQIVVET